MRAKLRQLLDLIRSYPFQLKHLSVLFLIIIAFQLILSLLHKSSLDKFLTGAQTWYQQDSAERLANLTATSLELILETRGQESLPNEREAATLVQGLNIILSQQILNQNVKHVAILVMENGKIHAIDEGQALYGYLFVKRERIRYADAAYAHAIEMYHKIRRHVTGKEEIYSLIEGRQTFHVFVPLVLRGELVGALYMENTPDFSSITEGIASNYDETAVTFSSLILLGLLAMFYISSYTVRARNTAQHMLFEKEKQRLADQINHQKELLFTKRIYHTHHKAEKVMGFIKEDLRTISHENIEEARARVVKYSNFISRVIYDMKWYDPPVQTIRGAMFRTNLNELLRFLVNNVFLRVSSGSDQVRFVFDLDESIAPVPVNEFVVWEVVEPIIQNCLEHAQSRPLTVTLRTRNEKHLIRMDISDNGVGIRSDLLAPGANGVKTIFHESVSTKAAGYQHSGYGCYIAYEIATQRCGWLCDIENLPDGGTRVTFLIPQPNSKEA
ncbi:MAG: histidine kinase [Ignavibacteriae bacterium]|nr:histidine kinase [Ignavibacteriota bacterium]